MQLPAAQKLVLVAVISVYIFYYSKCAASAVSKGGDGDSRNEPLVSSKSSMSVNVDSKAASTTKGAVNEKLNSQGNKGSSQETRFLLAKDPACAEDVMRLCDKSLHHNNFAVLDCVQDYKKTEESDISPDCHHLLWTYKRNLTKDDRFVEAGRTVCGTDINRFPDCMPLGDKPGHLLSCLMDYQENITNPQCKQFLTKMESIVFSDYRLIYQFADHCETDILKFKCGRMDNSDNSPHSQGDTIECLSKNPKELSPECQHEILRIAEIQSEDFHLDRPLFFACRDDRERFCENVPAGDGKVYRCLLHHKMHKDMSHECRDKLTRRQKLVSLDYKASKGLVKACREDIRAHRCREETSKNREIRLAQILMCLENALHKGFPVDGECQAEMLDHRRSLMEDFQLSPSVVHACENDIAKFCNEKLEGNGRTIHCLMEHARPTTRKKKRITEECKRELEVLVHETDAGEDWRVDPLLRESCQSVVDVACKGLRAGNGRVMSCLMDKVGSAQMTEECEDKLLQIQYFVARDYRLDPKLYQSCREDAKVFCNAGDNWADDLNKMGPHRGPLLPCLFRYARHPMDSLRMSTACIQQVKRVMRQRASNVDLHPEIEMACINDLADRCLEKVNKGEEIVCLQDNLESLDSDCQEAIRNYTEEEAENIELNRVVYKACEPILKMYCEDLIGDNVGQADMMECLVLHKNSYKMNKYEKCHAAVEHFQLISLKDYRFTFKFKNACKKDVVDFCKNVRTKSEVVTCLSELVRNDTLNENPPRVSKECRQQLRVELLQRNEDIELDPGLNEACNLDRQKFCNDILPGNAQVIECLKDHQKTLSDKCHLKIFNRQQEEMLDNSVDYTLVSVCKNMIKKYCDDHNPIDSLSCLKANKQDRNFDPKCRSIVLKRMAQQNEDYRLNPRLRNACSSEVKKFCHDIVYNKSGKDTTYEGKVIACLKEQFLARRLRVSCEDEISRIIRDTQLDYRQDPILAEACKVEIALHCSGSDLLDSDGRGRIEECLKIHFQKHDFKNECHKHVARLIQEGSTDVHLDPLLFKACALDLSHYCSDIPAGQGKQMKCLLDVTKSKSGMQDLQKECKTMLNQRVEMYNYAMKVAPENVQDIMDQVVISPARNYFIVVGLAILGIIFMSGLFCGRITKRVHYEMKRK